MVFEFFGGRGTIIRNSIPRKYIVVDHDEKNFREVVERLLNDNVGVIPYQEINVVGIRTREPPCEFEKYGMKIVRVITRSELTDLLQEYNSKQPLRQLVVKNDPESNIQELIF
jgi:hypothetical protein